MVVVGGNAVEEREMTLRMLIVMMLGTVIEIVTEISMVKAMVRVRVGKSQKTRNTQTVKLVAVMRTILESMPPRQKKT